MIVPSGPLSALPPGLLVTARRPSDEAPDGYRQTQWLIREKAITVLPAVASLKTLRQVIPATAAPRRRNIPLVAFADPDYRGEGHTPGVADGADVMAAVPLLDRNEEVRGARRSQDLEPLPGSLLESQALARLLGTSRQYLIVGKEATKAKLQQLSRDGTLRRTRVLSFATHGFVGGTFEGVAEPALALAASPRESPLAENGGLLTASEAAALDLNTEWVVLSACESASADPGDTDGLSSLARAFFKAGAESVMVSYWRIRSDVARNLVVGTFSNWTGSSKAKAVQKAMLRMIDEPSPPVGGLLWAHPAAWAPFVLMGAP